MQLALSGGDVVVTETGANFDGDGDYLTVQDFPYEDDGDFSIAFWITKGDCKDDREVFEFLYSHVQYTEGQHTSIDDRANSNINIYVACEKPGGADVGSTVDGSVLRANMIDSSSSWVLFDYPLAESALMDGITQTWVSVIITVTRHSVHLFIDGEVVDDSVFGFPTDAMGQCQDMSAMEPSCDALIGDKPVQAACDAQVATYDCAYSGVDCALFAQRSLSEFCESSCGGCTGSANPRAGITHNVK